MRILETTCVAPTLRFSETSVVLSLFFSFLFFSCRLQYWHSSVDIMMLILFLLFHCSQSRGIEAPQHQVSRVEVLRAALICGKTTNDGEVSVGNLHV